VGRDFVWRDAGRTVVFLAGGLVRAPKLLAEHGFAEFELLSTPRALAGAPALAAAASRVHEVGPGQVPDLAAELLDANAVVPGMREQLRSESGGGVLVAFGGGRVIDTAKALAAVTGDEVAAIPTTMSGAEMTGNHRLPAGAEDRARGLVRPRLVIADPEAMTSQPEGRLRASSMNALAHGADSLYTPLTNPVSEIAALRGAGLIGAALDLAPAERDAADLALGSVLCGYAIDSAGFGLHHVACQTLVRVCGTPHGETNAAILPHAASLLASRAPAAFAPLADALGVGPADLADRLIAIGQPAPLGNLASDPGRREAAVAAMLERPELASVPGPALTEADLAELVQRAW
jgi:maleylacetate reductase